MHPALALGYSYRLCDRTRKLGQTVHRFKAIVFDVDGTLADTERDGHRVAFNAAFREAGLDWFWDEKQYGDLLAVTGGKERILHYVRAARIALDPSIDIFSFAAELHRIKTKHFVGLLRAGAILLRPGVLRLLREARTEGVRLAIATTTTVENVSTLLDCAPEPELKSWFEVVAAGDVVTRKKPAPDIYSLVLEKMRLGASDCIAVEDSDLGVASALAAGLGAVLVTLSPYTANQSFAGLPLAVDSLGEPGKPARATVGDLLGKEWVDLEVLDRLHASVYPELR